MSGGMTIWVVGVAGQLRNAFVSELSAQLRARAVTHELLTDEGARRFQDLDRDASGAATELVCALLNRHGIVVVTVESALADETRQALRRRAGSLFLVHVDEGSAALREPPSFADHRFIAGRQSLHESVAELIAALEQRGLRALTSEPVRDAEAILMRRLVDLGYL